MIHSNMINYISGIVSKKNNLYIDENLRAQNKKNSFFIKILFFFGNHNQAVDWASNIFSIMKDVKYNISMFLKNKYSPRNNFKIYFVKIKEEKPIKKHQ